MKQIYYTQCPIGYGLGASNGFQIKRLTPGYPISGDFRHLGLRAFVAGTRTLVPPALRYRRGEDGSAEVAWLTPRTHEYETERGLWGRPGGHFAHGLSLDDAELEAIGNWPAGLYDRPFWARSDPSPSVGEPPRPLALTPADLRLAPTFDAFDRLVPAGEAETLARLLTALAVAVREARTLFLIDAPERLAERIALLTLAFAPPWRADLTFSTYHDRPEELPGLRLQGTIAAARPSRAALLSQGIVADLTAGTLEPNLEPARWATTLAGWLVRRGDDDRRSWESTGRRARLAHPKVGAAERWADDWLDSLYGFEEAVHRTQPPPSDLSAWGVLAGTTAWAARMGLDGELAEARPAGWWIEAEGEGTEARRALRTHVGLASAWRLDDEAARWGEAVARWADRAGPAEGRDLISEALGSAPPAARPRFVRALVAAMPPEEQQETLRWLETRPECDRILLLSLGVRAAVAEALDHNDPSRIRTILARAFALPGALLAVLDALAAEAAARPEALEAVGGWLAAPLEAASPRTLAEVLRWALAREDAEAWLGRFLRRAFAVPGSQDRWRSLLPLVPPPSHSAFARVVLAVASDPSLPGEAFRWGVEEVLLPVPEPDRPDDPRWPGLYLDQTPSGLELLRRLFGKDARRLGIRRWVERARESGALTRDQEARIVDCERYARALRSGDARALLDLRLPAVPAEERGRLLAQILDHVGRGGEDALNLALDTCRTAWPGAFEPGAAGLAGLARALADPLLVGRPDPSTWFGRLLQVLDRLGLGAEPASGFAPDGLAAELVAETVRRGDEGLDPWALRQFLFRGEAAWKALAADVRRELDQAGVAARLERFERWDRRLDKGLHTDRFFELWLNATDGPTLAAIVASRAADLRSLGRLSWWEAGREPGRRDDLRDAFARRAPMAPLPEESLPLIQGWLRPARGGGSSAVVDDSAPLAAEEPAPPGEAREESSIFSAGGAARWRCLEALSSIYRSGLGGQSCWNALAGWGRDLPLAALGADDRHRFLAWFLWKVDPTGPTQVDRLAKWLVDGGLADPDRVSRWADELEGLAAVPPDARLARAALVGELRVEIKNVLRDRREARRKTGPVDSP